MNSVVTGAAALPEDSSVLATLRNLVPHRQLTVNETKRIAELQANRLRLLFEIDGPAFPHEIIMDMPRIKVVFDADLPVSGSAHWNGHTWVIVLNALEGPTRQRFSLAHEFKHIIDHNIKHFLYRDGLDGSANKQAEQIADYFAGCLLMPKQHVKRLYYQGVQRPTELSEHFQVSARAVQFRLQQLGVVGDPARCSRFGGIRPIYYRNKSLAGALA
jgi:predicted transcriptional regulator